MVVAEAGPLSEKSLLKAYLLMASGSATAIHVYQRNTFRPRMEVEIMVGGVSAIKSGKIAIANI